MDIRRVVTGENPDGKAVFVEDERVTATATRLSPITYHELWRQDATPILPSAGENGTKSAFFPQQGGYRFFIVTFPPGAGHVGDLAGVDIEQARRETEEKLPGVLETLDPDDPGMHRTDTVDMEILLSGELVLELDDGVETVLRAGDTNIQNGTRHRWHNRGTEPAVLACFVVGGVRK